MAKRFTDTGKWRKAWFRSLPIKAKLVWLFLCDEAEFHGVVKIDWELASFQIGFTITPDDLRSWFGDRIHFIDQWNILIVPFYEFQYGTGKSNWTAKIRAKDRLESLGFSITDNHVIIPKGDRPPTEGGESPVSGTTGLGIDIGIGIGKGIGKESSKSKFDFELAYSHYPRKIGKSKAFAVLAKTIKTDEQFASLVQAIQNFALKCTNEQTDEKFIPHFNNFIGSVAIPSWQEFVSFESRAAKPPEKEFNPLNSSCF